MLLVTIVEKEVRSWFKPATNQKVANQALFQKFKLGDWAIFLECDIMVLLVAISSRMFKQELASAY